MPSDRDAIENTLHRYAFGYDEGDWKLVESTFTADAQLSLRVTGGELAGPFTGRDAIIDMMDETAKTQPDQRRHVTSNVVVDVDGDRATAWSYLTIFSAHDGTLTALSTGTYEDELVRAADGWRLSMRHIALDLPH